MRTILVAAALVGMLGCRGSGGRFRGGVVLADPSGRCDLVSVAAQVSSTGIERGVAEARTAEWNALTTSLVQSPTTCEEVRPWVCAAEQSHGTDFCQQAAAHDSRNDKTCAFAFSEANTIVSTFEWMGRTTPGQCSPLFAGVLISEFLRSVVYPNGVQDDETTTCQTANRLCDELRASFSQLPEDSPLVGPVGRKVLECSKMRDAELNIRNSAREGTLSPRVDVRCLITSGCYGVIRAVFPDSPIATSGCSIEANACVVLGDLCDTVVEAERSTQYNDPNYNKILPDYTACLQALKEAVAYDDVAERAWKMGDEALSAKARCTQTNMCVRILRQMVPKAQFAEPNCVGLY